MIWLFVLHITICVWHAHISKAILQNVVLMHSFIIHFVVFDWCWWNDGWCKMVDNGSYLYYILPVAGKLMQKTCACIRITTDHITKNSALSWQLTKYHQFNTLPVPLGGSVTLFRIFFPFSFSWWKATTIFFFHSVSIIVGPVQTNYVFLHVAPAHLLA